MTGNDCASPVRTMSHLETKVESLRGPSDQFGLRPSTVRYNCDDRFRGSVPDEIVDTRTLPRGVFVGFWTSETVRDVQTFSTHTHTCTCPV